MSWKRATSEWGFGGVGGWGRQTKEASMEEKARESWSFGGVDGKRVRQDKMMLIPKEKGVVHDVSTSVNSCLNVWFKKKSFI